MRRILCIGSTMGTLAVFALPAVSAPRQRVRGTSKDLRMDDMMLMVDRELVRRARRRVRPLAPLTAGARSGRKTLSPYFWVKSTRRDVDTLPLKKTSAQVRIAGVIARVKITQVYQNTGMNPLEAIYVFPGSTRAAVHGLRMRIGKRLIQARIRTRARARRAYERARRLRRRASLLEQQRSNVFTMQVANIQPGDTITCELVYSELLVPEDGTYTFVYPAVVGPRYGRGADPRRDRWIRAPYARGKRKPLYGFGLEVRLETPIALKKYHSPSHKIRGVSLSKKRVRIALAKPGGGDRDFVLKYRLAGGKIETGVMTYDAGYERYFLVMVEPPLRIVPKQIPSREYIFVLDVSGSMYGFPLKTAKALITNLLRSLRPTDYFNVVLFAGASLLMSQRSLPARKATIERAIRVIDKQRGGGTTQLMPALRTAYGVPVISRKVARSVVVITDGYVAVESHTFRYVRRHLKDANCFAFGIGTSVNRALLEGLSRAGLGGSFVVSDATKADDEAKRFRQYISAPVLTRIALTYKASEVYDVVPAQPPDLLAQRPLVIFGKFRGKTTIRVAAHTAAGPFQRTLALVSPKAGEARRPLRVLWARRWVQELMDQFAVLPYSRTIRTAVTHLGLRYDLLTQFTSFVAVDKRRARRTGAAVRIRQPLPLPYGVPVSGVGGTGAVPTTGSPGSVRYKVMAKKRARDDAAPESVMPCAKAPRFRGCGCGSSGSTDDSLPVSPLLPLLGWLLLRRRRRCDKRPQDEEERSK